MTRFIAAHDRCLITVYKVAQKTEPPYLIANILKIPWPNCMEIGELLQYYMLNTVINFLFKNFIALWRHLAKTQLLCDAQIYLYNVNKRQYSSGELRGNGRCGVFAGKTVWSTPERLRREVLTTRRSQGT